MKKAALVFAAAAGRAARTLWGARPSFRDLHVYGGAALVAAGVGSYSEPAAMIVFGAALLYIGRP